MEGQSYAPGWYPDPKEKGVQRWWDGSKWGPNRRYDPPASWQPKPNQPDRLVWWDGSDWTDYSRPNRIEFSAPGLAKSRTRFAWLLLLLGISSEIAFFLWSKHRPINIGGAANPDYVGPAFFGVVAISLKMMMMAATYSFTNKLRAGGGKTALYCLLTLPTVLWLIPLLALSAEGGQRIRDLQRPPPELEGSTNDAAGARHSPSSPASHPSGPRSSGASAPSDPLQQLREIAALHEAGVLTNEEFAEMKAELLRRV